MHSSRERFAPSTTTPLMQLWAEKHMGSKKDLASSVLFLKGICGETTANDEMKVE